MKVLVTGGAGFIGSNFVKFLLDQPNVSHVRVFDNLATGHLRNIEPFMSNEKFDFVEGDIRNYKDCLRACEGMSCISHQAALGSVPRSISDPMTSHDVNGNGFVNMIEAARQSGITKFAYASSSAVYGDLKDSPKVESRVGKVLSPYASTKMANELYAESYSKNYEMQFTGFRYFNVFGPAQDPNGPYAAVIPLFVKAALLNESPLINGDGTITRDFTPVANVVQANWKALTEQTSYSHKVFNIACGQTTSLNELWDLIKEITNSSAEATHGPLRKGDIMFSLAEIMEAVKELNYEPITDLKATMESTIEYYKQPGIL